MDFNFLYTLHYLTWASCLLGDLENSALHLCVVLIFFSVFELLFAGEFPRNYRYYNLIGFKRILFTWMRNGSLFSWQELRLMRGHSSVHAGFAAMSGWTFTNCQWITPFHCAKCNVRLSCKALILNCTVSISTYVVLFFLKVIEMTSKFQKENWFLISLFFISLFLLLTCFF